MEDKNKNIGDSPLGGVSTQALQPTPEEQGLYSGPQALSAMPDVAPQPVLSAADLRPNKKRSWLRLGIYAAVLVLLGVSGFGAYSSSKRNLAGVTAGADASRRYETAVVSLDGISVEPIVSLSNTRTVTINGTLTIKEGLIIAPSVQPTNAQAGQIYYDINSSTLTYFNGSEFVSVGGQFVEELGGLTGNVVVGSGLSTAGGRLANSGVLSVQGQSGNVSFVGGNGISVNGTTITNKGVISVTAGSPSITVSDDGNGNITITPVGGGSGTVSSPGGTAGRLSKFTAGQVIEDSLISEAGTTITVNGNLSVTGAVSLTSALAVASGGTGVASLGANGVLVGNGASAITSLVSGVAGQCLVSTAGAPAWSTCSPPSSTVNSLNGLTGTLTLANATGLVDTITVDDASTTNKGIVQFNSTNFSVSGGTANTIQNISTSASPSFSSLTLSGDVTVNGGDITSTGALNITPAGGLTAGSTNQALTIQGNASSVFTATNGGNTTTVSFQAPTANVTYRFATAAVGSYDICTTAGNCGGGGGSITGSGTSGVIPKFTGASTVGDSLISETGAVITVNGNLNLTTSNQFQINGTQISSANLSNDANLAKLNASQTFTGNNVTFQNAANSATALAIQNALGNRLVTVDTLGGELELGQGSTIGGRLVYNNAANANTVTLVSATATGSRTITLPDDSGTICLDTGNCAGAGATLQTSYNNSSNPEITLDATRGALTLRDNSTPLGANLFEVQSNNGLTTYFSVTSGGVSVTGTATATGNINSSGGALQTGGTTRVDNTGNLANIGNLGLSGSISGGTTYSGSGNINTTGGAIQTNSTNRIDNGGNLINIGTVTTSGAINSQTISSAANFTGTVTIQGSNALTLGTTGTSTGVVLFKGATAASGTLTLAGQPNPSNNTLTLPNETGTICTTGSVCSGYQAAGSYANTALSNLASVAINTTLLPGSAGGINLGSGTLPFGDIFLAGTSGTPGTNNFRITGASTSGTRVITIPDATGTLCLTTGNCAGSGSGVTSSSGGTANRLAKFTAAQNIEDSTITDNGTTVTTSVDIVIQGGDATLGVASSQTGTLNFAHSGSASLGSIVQGALTGGRTYTLPDASGTFCLTSGNCSGAGSSSTLQAAYDAGNNITTTTGRDIDIVLANTVADSNFDIVVADDSTSFVSVSRADGTGTNDPSQLVLIDNLDATRPVAAGIKLQAAAGGLTTAIDASDAEIVDALSVGANDIVGTTGNISFTNFGVTGSNGNVTGGTYNGQTISSTASFTGTLGVTGNTTLTGDLAVNGGDITSSGALNITPGGALTVGSTGQTALLQGSTTTITSSGVGNDIVLNSADTIELQDNTNVSGNTDVSGSLVAGTADAFQVAANGNVTTVGNVTLQGGTITVGASAQAGSIVIYDGSSNTGTIQVAALGQDTTYTLPDPSGVSATICLSTGNCLGPGGSGANTALSNLASVAINTTLLPGSAGAISLGSATLPFGDLYLSGTSGTPGTNNFRITGASTSGTRTITLPDDSGTVCINTNNCSYAPASGSANYIQNQIASPQAADFNISGDGRAATLNATTGINTGAGAGTNRIDNSGNLVNIGSISLSGAISGGTTYSGSGNINTTGGAIQTNSVSRIDVSGNLTNIGNLTAAGAITIASTNAGNDVVVDGADQFIVQDAAVFNGVATFNADVDLVLADTENISITNTVTGTNAIDLISMVLTNNTASGIQQVALLQNAAGTGGTESLLVLDNADADTAVASGLQITSAAGAITNALDVSDSDIVTALLFGANNITGTNFSVDGSNGNVTGGTYNGQTLSATANLTGSLTVATNLTLTSGDIAVNGGDITSSGALNITSGGTLTVGSSTQTLTLQGGAGTTFKATSGANTTTVGFAAPTANTTLNFPALAAGTYDICTSSGNCLGAGVTLQATYNNSTNPELVVDATRGALTVRDNATPIGANLFEVQNNDASTTYFAASSSGINTTGTNTSSGNVNSTAGTIQTNSTNRITNAGDLVNIGNLTATGAITVSSTGATNDIVLNSADTIELQDATNVTGTFSTTSTITVGALGAADTATYLCRNSSNQLAACNTTGAGAAFVQGGNAFGAPATLGTNDNNGLDIRTNSTTRLSIGAGGGIIVQGNATADELEIGDDIFNINDANTRLNLGSTAGDTYIRMGESALAFGFVGWQNSTNAMRLSTFGSQDLRLETNSATRITVSGAGVTTVTGTGSNGVAGFNVNTTQNTTTGLQPGNILTTTFDPGGSASASYFSNQMLANIGSTGTTFTGDIIANLGQVNWSGAGNTSNTGKLYGTVGKVVTASGAGSVQNAVALFSQLQYAGGTTVTNSYNVYASNLQSGATTNLYGFYAESMTGGTNNYPLYLASGTANQPLLSVTGTGATTFQNSTNSSSAFQVQNTIGQSALSIDTTTPNLITNSSIETDTTGWSAKGSATTSRITTQYYAGNASLQSATTAAAGDGAKLSYSLASSTQYSFSVFVKTDVPAIFGNALEIGRSDDGSTDTSCSTNQPLYSGWARYKCTFTTGTVSGSPYLYVKQVDTSARNLWIDGAQLETAASSTRYLEGKTSIGSLAVNASQSFITSSNATMYVQAASGGEGVIVRGNGDGNVFQNAFQVTTSSGTTIFNVNDTSTGVSVQGGNSFLGASALQVVSADSGARALEVKAASGQTADVLQVVNNSSATMFSVGATGAVLSKNTSNSTTAFQVQNAAGTSQITVDTTNSRVQVGASDTTGALLILDTKTDINDPTGVNGAMYYNSAYGRFRCYQNSAWVDCISSSPKEYLMASRSTTQTSNITTSSRVQYDGVAASAGGSISLDTDAYASGGGQITLAAGKTYRLNARTMAVYGTADSQTTYQWYNVTAGASIGAGAYNNSTNRNDSTGTVDESEAIITPAVTTVVELRMTIGAGSITNIQPSSNGTGAYVEVLSDGGAGGASAAEYMHAERQTIQNGTEVDAADDHINFASVVASSGSSISLDTTTAYGTGSGASRGRFTLQAGKTYRLSVSVPYVDFGASAQGYFIYSWYNVTAGAEVSQRAFMQSIARSAFNYGSDGGAQTVISPSVTTIVEVRTIDHSGVSGIGGSPYNPNVFIEVISDGTKIAQFQGATAGVDGQGGFVLKPVAGQQGSLLLGDGTWSTGLTFVNGSLGIGISPTSKLHVYEGTTGGTSLAMFRDNPNGSAIEIISTATDTPLLRAGGNDSLNFAANNSATAHLSIGTGGNITVGTSDTTGALLVLDTKTGTGDPTGVNGGMYYNSNYGRLRCYENSIWKNCVNSGPTIVTFTAGGTFSKATYPWASKVKVRAQAGGGAGAGAAAAASGQHTCGAGGGGGGYAERWLDISALGANETVTVGAGGNGVSGGSTGASGGNSSFGALVVANGGSGGNAAGSSAATFGAVGGAGGTGGTGDLIISGGTGQLCFGGGTLGNGGGGASSHMGGGGIGTHTVSSGDSVNGGNAPDYGGGGGGATVSSTGTAATGGNAGDGIVIVEIY